MNDPVLIDQREPAYTVLLRIPVDKLAELRPGLEGAPEVRLVDWSAFAAEPRRHAAAHLLRDDYPDQDAVGSVLRLLERYAGAPVGLTWNGGIAFTFTDYQHAKRTLERYTADPVEYERGRTRDAAADPVHPAGHVSALLGD